MCGHQRSRERFELSRLIAELISADNEPGGRTEHAVRAQGTHAPERNRCGSRRVERCRRGRASRLELAARQPEPPRPPDQLERRGRIANVHELIDGA
jgi:hypothetical protein